VEDTDHSSKLVLLLGEDFENDFIRLLLLFLLSEQFASTSMRPRARSTLL